MKNANERSPEYARVKKNVSPLIHPCPFAYRHACACAGNQCGCYGAFTLRIPAAGSLQVSTALPGPVPELALMLHCDSPRHVVHGR